MARVVYSGIVTELKGSIGGTTFQRNASAAIARNKPYNFKNSSSYQQVIKGYMTQAATSWANASLSVKQAWNDFASANVKTNRWSGDKTVTGYQFFIACFINAKIAGQVPIVDNPIASWPSAPTSFNVLLSGGVLSIQFVEEFVSTDQYLFLFATPPVAASSLKQRKNLYLLSVLPAGVYSTLNITAYWCNAFNMLSMPAVYGSGYYVGVEIFAVHSESFINSSHQLNITQAAL
jgi:hypothetical protein